MKIKNILRTKNLGVKQFIIKTATIASLVVWILGKKVSDFLTALISLLIEPFFSIDLNQNGEPDLKEIANYNLKIGNKKIPIGRIILEFIKLVLHLLSIYLLVYFVLNHTDLISFKN